MEGCLLSLLFLSSSSISILSPSVPSSLSIISLTSVSNALISSLPSPLYRSPLLFQCLSLCPFFPSPSLGPVSRVQFRALPFRKCLFVSVTICVCLSEDLILSEDFISVFLFLFLCLCVCVCRVLSRFSLRGCCPPPRSASLCLCLSLHFFHCPR